jgi:UDP-N-acetylmuramate dehydrogenase
MQISEAALTGIPGLSIHHDAPLSQYARFGVGGPADVLADAATETAFIEAVTAVRKSGIPFTVIGGGSNLIVADEGFRGVVLRFTANSISNGNGTVRAAAGAVLQDLVDHTIAQGLAGMHTMTGIPGWTGAAVYGNAGAYGHSIEEFVAKVRFFDGAGIAEFDNAQCEFRYRESSFKHCKNRIIFSTELGNFATADPAALKKEAAGILAVRNAKYPPTMKCAGSIFKNLIYAELPESVQAHVPPDRILGGKVPSAYFLELVGAKGMENGDIRVADYHANLIYNAGNGTARQVREIIDDLKARVRAQFAFQVEEEVQYVGFSDTRGK